MALEPRPIWLSLVRRAEQSQPVLQCCRLTQIDVARRDRRLGQVEMCVRQSRDGDLIEVETYPLGEGISAGLEVDFGTGERDPTTADADRLDPAEPGHT